MLVLRDGHLPRMKTTDTLRSAVHNSNHMPVKSCIDLNYQGWPRLGARLQVR